MPKQSQVSDFQELSMFSYASDLSGIFFAILTDFCMLLKHHKETVNKIHIHFYQMSLDMNKGGLGFHIFLFFSICRCVVS